MTQRISDYYANNDHLIQQGERLHRLVALLLDTYYDDLTPEFLRQLEEQVEARRWMNADGQRVDLP